LTETTGRTTFFKGLGNIVGSLVSEDYGILRRKVFELNAAYDIARTISSTFELEKCLKILVDKISDVILVEIVSVMLVDKEKSDLVIKLAKGLDEKIIKETRVKIGENIAGWVLKTGEPVLLTDITKDPRFTVRGGKYYTNSLLSVPLKLGAKTIGVINVNNKRSRDIFHKDDLSALSMIADMSAGFIEGVRLQEESKTLDKMKSDFVINVSHELRTPLTAVRENVSVVADGIKGPLNDGQLKFLGLAVENIDRLSRLIDGLLELAKLESKKMASKRRLFDIVSTLRMIVSSLEPLAKEKGVALVAHIPADEIEMWGDADKICEVAINLLDNAIKYNRPGGKAELRLEDGDNNVTLSVYDTGIGIKHEDFNRIFDRFLRIEKPADGKIKGIGLGLAITREIVLMHGGEITVESELGRWTRFTVKLPKGLRKIR
jgi:signal transduction histidine kinase